MLIHTTHNNISIDKFALHIMGKKSKRVRSGGGAAVAQSMPAPSSPAMIVDENVSASGADRPAKKMTNAQRQTGSTGEEEETMDNLRFQDPYIDEYEEEEILDDGDGAAMEGDDGDGGDRKISAARDPHHFDGQDVIRSWNPLTSDPLAPGEKLEVDPTAYKMLHGLTPEWPSLSFDFIRDDLGENRTRFPHTAIVAVGSQADRPDKNKLTIMKLSDLARTGVVKTKEEEEDEILGEEFNPDEDSDDSDDEDDEEEDDEIADLDPIVEPFSLRHEGGINRIRVMPQHSEVVATWSDTGTVNLYDVRGILDIFNRSAGGGDDGRGGGKFRRDPFFVYQGHSTEGYAMDWSRVKAGQMATGDCDGNIHLWQMANGGAGGSWNNSSFAVSSTYGPSGGNIDQPSVEDIQWSPTEATVFATAECGGYVKVYDVRCKDRAMISNKIHSNGADVNVLAWNGLVSNLLATGGDDGVLTVWDLRNFQSSPASGADTPSPLARFTAHRNPITSLEWHPTDESMIAVSDEAGTYIYDLSIEEDEPNEDSGAGGGAGGEGGEIPPQLLFVHCGSESVKEVHWHPQVASMVMTTALTGLSMFIPSNL